MIKDFFDGIFSYFRAIKIIKERKLWSYFLIPGLISIGFFLVIGLVAWFTSDNMGAWISGIWPFDWGKDVITTAGGVIYSILMIIVSIILFRYIIIIALGPFLSPLSEKIEYSITRKRADKPNIRQNVRLISRGITVAIALLTLELIFTIPLYLLILVSGGVGAILTPLIFVIQSYYAGRGNMDFIFERRFNVVKSLRKGRQYGWLAIGNGLVYLMMISSIIGIFFAPILSVAGLTVELVKRLEKEEGNDIV